MLVQIIAKLHFLLKLKIDKTVPKESVNFKTTVD